MFFSSLKRVLNTHRSENKFAKTLIASGIATTALSLLPIHEAVAHQANAVSWQVVKAGEIGSFKPGVNMGGDENVVVELFPNHRDSQNQLLVMFPGCSEDAPTNDLPIRNLDELIKDPNAKPMYIDMDEVEPRWQACPDKNNILVDQHHELEISVDFIRSVSEGMAVNVVGEVHVVPRSLMKKFRSADSLAKYFEGRQPAADLNIDLLYRLDSRSNIWQFGSYEKIFGSASEGPKVTLDYEQNFANLPVNLNSYRIERKLPEIEKDFSIDEVIKDIVRNGSGLGKEESDPIINLDSLIQVQRPISVAQFSPLKRSVFDSAVEMSSYSDLDYAGGSFNLSGKFSTRWSSDHALHAGFGFRVEAWTNETGSWQKLASDWVQYNGSWELTVPASAGYNGDHLRVLYRSYNSYYRPQNQSNDTYSWRDPDRYNIGNNFSAGHRYADTDGGDYNGVGELVDAAMLMWSRLYWHADVNPVPADPIDVYFPNTWYDCGSGSGVPWSCARSSTDEIWLTAAHGTQASVVTHELAHSLNNKFWDRKRPAGSGGSHTLTGCYPTRLGMALREGFANFVAAWVGYPERNVAEGNFNTTRWNLAFDPEQSHTSPSCTNGWENETWVARTFWDLHDTRADGDDILWFNHKGAVINLYLANGIANNGDARDMRDYENIYRNAASSGHEGYITDIFEHNRM